jgi:hypothetical protein
MIAATVIVFCAGRELTAEDSPVIDRQALAERRIMKMKPSRLFLMLAFSVVTSAAAQETTQSRPWLGCFPPATGTWTPSRRRPRLIRPMRRWPRTWRRCSTKGCPGARSLPGCSPTTACQRLYLARKYRGWCWCMEVADRLSMPGSGCGTPAAMPPSPWILADACPSARTASGSGTTPADRPVGAASIRSMNRPKIIGPITPSPTWFWPIRSCGRCPGSIRSGSG